MRYFMLLLLAGLLAGCGGSSGSDNTPPTQVNTAPVLTGQLNMQLSAASAGSVNLALADAENDTLAVSYTNKPAWVQGTLNANQLLLSATPGFFHVGTHQFVVRVSDGKLHSDYTITLNVADDPSKWTEIATSKAEFIGQWALDNGDSLYLYPNETGRYFAKNGEVFNLTWFYLNGYIEISSQKINCISDCSEYFEAYVIAADTDRKRLVLESDDSMLAVTIQRYTSADASSGSYVMPYTAVDFVSEIVNDNIKLYLPLLLSHNGYSEYSTVEMNTRLVQGDVGVEVIPLQDVSNTTIDFLHINSGNEVQLELQIDLLSANLLTASDGMLVLAYQFGARLTDTNIEASAYYGLTEFLTQQPVRYIEMLRSPTVAVPEIALNSTYHSAFRFEPSSIIEDFLFGGTEVIFTTNQQGKAKFEIPGATPLDDIQFDWAVTGSELQIQLDSQQYSYRFIEHPVFGLSMVTSRDVYYPFVKRTEVFSVNDIIGSFRLEDVMGFSAVYHNIYNNHLASLSSSYPDTSTHSYGASYKWQEQGNGSITLLYANACAAELDYESCEDDLIQRLANGEPVLLYYRNLRVVAKTQENTIVQISYNYTTQTMKQRYQSIQRWTNVPAQ
ncbi:hypothetical protein [Rheinheimera hassiensis]|uniref:hypothetical protein n=1 Tax=Rheinheimera hassiensis TaxID=1193627 RepID=UPI001F062F83|nr:hypothetical protein [Rheinheimera hassiensis]